MKSIDHESIDEANKNDPPSDAVAYLTFSLNNETYGFEIGKVKEIVDWGAVTRVPRMPDYLLGVINLRGSVVTVIDLMAKLRLGKAEKTEDSCLIVVEAAVAGETALFGIVVDAVFDVVHLKAGDMAGEDGAETHLRSRYVRRMGRTGGGIVPMIDIDAVLAEETDFTEHPDTDSTTDVECRAQLQSEPDNGDSAADPFPG